MSLAHPHSVPQTRYDLRPFVFSIELIAIVSVGSYFIVPFIGYGVVALVLLLAVSFIAMVSNTKPAIILPVKSDDGNIVNALINGTNGYMIKPFRIGELPARIRSVFRNADSEIETTEITSKDLHIDLALGLVKKAGEIIKLTATEYQLLALLARNEGKVLTHQYLLRDVWGTGYINQSQYLRAFIARLRKKNETDPNRPEIIITESGVGYRFTVKG